MSPESRRKIYAFIVIFCGEFIGTAFLMIFGCMGMNDRHLNLTHSALAWGFAVIAVITAFGHLTQSHINPVVTTCLLILGFIEPYTALIYYVAEFLGAIFGFFLVLVMTHNYVLHNVTDPESGFCLTTVASEIPVAQGVLCEFIATSLLIFAVCSVTDRRNAMWGDSIAIKIGFTVGVLVYSAGPITGASMNPARSFAPALLYMKWKHQWVYWVGPFGGSIFASLIYKFIFMASVDDALTEKVVKPASSSALKQGALVVDAYNPECGTTKIKSSEVSSQLKTEMVIQEDTAFVSDKLQ